MSLSIIDKYVLLRMNEAASARLPTNLATPLVRYSLRYHKFYSQFLRASERTNDRLINLSQVSAPSSGVAAIRYMIKKKKEIEKIKY